MFDFENQNVEFKQEYVPDIREEVMGFANADCKFPKGCACA